MPLTGDELWLACGSGNLDRVKWHKGDGGDLQAKNSWGSTGLGAAAGRGGHDDVVRYLLAERCEVNCRDNDGWTPLMDAARCGRSECTRMLLQAGADPTLTSAGRRSMTAEGWAQEEGKAEVVSILRAHATMQQAQPPATAHVAAAAHPELQAQGQAEEGEPQHGAALDEVDNGEASPHTAAVDLKELKQAQPISADEPEIQVATAWGNELLARDFSGSAAPLSEHLHFPRDDAGTSTKSAAIELFRSKYPPELVQLMTIFSEAECATLIKAAEGYGFGHTK